MGAFRKNTVVVIIHILVWALVFLLLQTVGAPKQIKINPTRVIITGLLFVTVFYLNFLVFVPLFLSQKQIIQFLCVNIILLFAVFIVSKELVIKYPDVILNTEQFAHKLPQNGPAPWHGPDPNQQSNLDQRSGPNPNHGPGPSPDHFKDDLPKHSGFIGMVIGFLVIAVSTSIKVTQSWYTNEEQRKEMQNEKLSAELLFLKSQINPHFFFNTLNSIYYLAQTKSDLSPVAILKLSEIMRYIIYEAIREKVPLKKELDYIQNYIDLQLLRLNENMKVEYHVNVTNENLLIGPMLLIPFVENAFKHGIDFAQNSTITIVASTEENLLTFSITNPKMQQNRVNLVSSGVGLQNVKKRLELLYPNKYSLNIKEGSHFTVELIINLE